MLRGLVSHLKKARVFLFVFLLILISGPAQGQINFGDFDFGDQQMELSMDWEPKASCPQILFATFFFPFGEPPTQCSYDLTELKKHRDDLKNAVVAWPRAPAGEPGRISKMDRPDLDPKSVHPQCRSGAESTAIRVGEFSGTAQDNYTLTWGSDLEVMQTVDGLPNESLGLRCSIYISNMSDVTQYLEAYGTFIAQEQTQIQPRVIVPPADDCKAAEQTEWTALKSEIKELYGKLDANQRSSLKNSVVTSKYDVKILGMTTRAPAGAGLSRDGKSGWFEVPPGTTAVMTFQNPSVNIVGKYPGMRRMVAKICSGWVRACSKFSETTSGKKPFFIAGGNIESIVSTHTGENKTGSLKSTAFDFNRGRAF